MSPAEWVRQRLAEHRQQGLEFDVAWHAAVAAIPRVARSTHHGPAEGGSGVVETKHADREWAHAIGAARSAFRRGVRG